MERGLSSSRFFFSHGNSNSYGVLTAYFVMEPFNIKKQQTDKEGRILILDASINLFELLEEFDTNPKKQLIMAEDFYLFFDSKFDAHRVGTLT